MSGSIDGKSLGDSTSLRYARQNRANSRPERDLSPSSIYSFNDQPTASRLPTQRLGFAQHPTTASNGFLSIGQSDVNDPTSDANRDPFRVRSLLDNLRQILNDDELEEQSINKSNKKWVSHQLEVSMWFRRPPTAPKQHHKSANNVGGSKVTAKVQYDTHQRALSVQIPSESTSLRRSMPSLANADPVESLLTPTGTVLGNLPKSSDVGEQSGSKTRRQRFVNFFRSSRNNDKPSEDNWASSLVIYRCSNVCGFLSSFVSV